MAVAAPEPQVRSYTLDLENKGLMIARPGDMIPPGYFSLFTNMTANKSGFIESRGGSNRVNPANELPSSVHSQGRIIINNLPYTYQGAGTKLYREYAEIADGFSGNILTMRNGGPDQSILPQMIVFDALKRVKDNGQVTTNFGIAGSMEMADAVGVAVATKSIDLFDYPDNTAIQAEWAATDSVVTTSALNPVQGSHCANFVVLASTVGYMDKTQTIDLSGFSVPGDSTDNDYIVIWIRCDIPANLTSIKVYFDVDPSVNDFTSNYYVATIDPVELPSGTFQWKQFFIRKGSFDRVGTSSNNWADVKKIRLEGVTNVAGDVNIGFDVFEMSTGDNLNASDYDWIFRYLDINTNSVSPFSPVMTTDVSVDHGNAAVTVRNPRDTQATHIQLFRRGGANSEYQFCLQQLVTQWSGYVTITDSVADANQGQTVDTSQVELSNLLVTTSQPATKVLKTTNNGSSFTDYTAAVSDDSGATYADLSALSTLANGDFLLIGADQEFREILIQLVGAVNANASTMSVDYWNGTSWRPVPLLDDGTALAGSTFSQNGIIQYDFPSDWAKATLASTMAFYVRITVSATLSSPVHVDEVRLSANAFNPTVCEIHGGRLWTNDSRHRDRLWFSERFGIEEFLEDNYVIVGSSGDPMERPFALDDQIFALTDKSVQRIIGSNEDSFQPIATGSETGLFSVNAICRGRAKIFYRGYDGIYALPGSGFSVKISIDIDPIFHGIAGGLEAELQPIDKNYASTEVMEFFGGKIYFGYRATNGTRYELILDLDAPTPRWEQTNRQTSSYLPIESQNKLYEGVSTDGYVYEVGTTSNTDLDDAIQMNFRSPYIDFGAPSDTKQITEIVVDCDLAEQDIAFFADLDNGVQTSQTVIRSNTEREPIHFPLADDTEARNVALRVSSNNGGELVKFFKITFFYIELPTPVTILPTGWSDLGLSADKRLRQLQIEIDTQGADAEVQVQCDGEIVQTLTVNTPGRRSVQLSLEADVIGNLTRLIISGATPFRYYTHEFEFVPDPLEMTRYDTIELDFGYTRFKYIRRMWIAANTPATVTLTIYIDQVLRHTETFIVQSESGWKKIELTMPAGLMGMLFRFVFTAESSFKVFLDQSDVEWHPWAGNRGYERARLAQPTG